MSTLTIRHVVVRGRVQGVGYRAWTEDTAILTASTAGCATGATARSRRCSRGRAEAVDGMIEACRRGPESARVDAVDVFEAGPAELALRRGEDGFSVLPTA